MKAEATKNAREKREKETIEIKAMSDAPKECPSCPLLCREDTAFVCMVYERVCVNCKRAN